MFSRSPARIRRRLTAIAREVADLRQRHAVLVEQVTFLTQVEEEARTDAVVGGTPAHARDHATAASDLARARRERDEVATAIADMLAEQDGLLERLLD